MGPSWRTTANCILQGSERNFQSLQHKEMSGTWGLGLAFWGSGWGHCASIPYGCQFVSATHMGHLDKAPGFSLAVEGIWGITSGRSVSRSNFQINVLVTDLITHRYWNARLNPIHTYNHHVLIKNRLSLIRKDTQVSQQLIFTSMSAEAERRSQELGMVLPHRWQVPKYLRQLAVLQKCRVKLGFEPGHSNMSCGYSRWQA